MKLSEIRAQYPEYSDLPDEQLVIGLHRKFYSDIPFKDFHKNITYDFLPQEKKFDVSKVQREGGAFATPTYEGKPLTKEQAYEFYRTKSWGTGVPQFAYDLGGKVTDATNSPAAGYLANVATQAVPALLAGSKFQGAPEVSMTRAPAASLMQSALKPSVADLKSKDAGRAIETMLQEGISPTRGGMNKAAGLADKLNESVAAPIAASTADASIPAVIQRLDALKKRAALQVNPEADLSAIERAISEFKNSPAISNAESIPVQLAQKLKSGTYSSIGNKSYGELASSSVEAQKQLAAGLRGEVIAKVPSIVEPLKREAALRNVMEVSANRALMDSNKNPLALGTSIAAIMHDPLAAAGMWANASTPIKAMMARMLYTAGKPSVALPSTIAAQEALNRPKE